MKNLFILFGFLAFIFTSSAQAGFLLEPYIGTNLNSTYKDNLNTCTSNCDGSVSGTAIGGRVGFQNFGFMLGLNGKQVTYDIEHQSNDMKTTTVGAFVGYDFPIMLRVWAEYIFSGTGKFDDSVNSEYQLKSGTNLGIGYKLMPFVSLNLEIGAMNFDELKYDGGSQKLDTDLNTYLVSLSFPITL